MRELLFRAKAINREKGEHRTNYNNGDWVYGLISKPYNDCFPDLPAEMRNEKGVSGIEVDYKTICQYTGMTDRNGKKIFEGDVVVAEVVSERVGNELCLVIFDEDKACFQLCSKFDIYDVGDFNYDTDVKVIGNILDTPELMKIAFYNGIFRIDNGRIKKMLCGG